MGRTRIRRFGVLQTSLFVGALYAILTAVIFIPIALIVLAVGAATSGGEELLGGAVGMVVLAVLAPIFYGLTGFIFTAIGCLVYNSLAGWIGGIEVELENSHGELQSQTASGVPASQ